MEYGNFLNNKADEPLLLKMYQSSTFLSKLRSLLVKYIVEKYLYSSKLLKVRLVNINNWLWRYLLSEFDYLIFFLVVMFLKKLDSVSADNKEEKKVYLGRIL